MGRNPEGDDFYTLIDDYTYYCRHCFGRDGPKLVLQSYRHRHIRLLRWCYLLALDVLTGAHALHTRCRIGIHNQCLRYTASQEKHSGTLSAIEDDEGHPGDQRSYHNRI
ncbi:hypothetical protein DVH24_004173 [Malus domestica]|uniref:Uncharacterized protein n=1 Tax=Malus domestica TaxID=3750 RepID=A0A498K7N6_MALDO|nr:hypothetical protein DVH24_004173 [Malus domestica]